MSATPHAGPRGGLWPTALLLAMASFVLLDRAVWTSDRALRFLDRYTPLGPTDSLMTVKARLVPAAVEAPLVLLMGSSQVREGLDCGILEERLPTVRCRNLASIGGTPLDALYLQSRIPSRSDRRTMVVGVFPWMFHQGPKTYFTDADTVRCLSGGGAWRAMTWNEDRAVAYGLLANASESLRNREALPRIFDVVSDDPLGALWLERPPPASRLGSPLGAQLFRPASVLEQRLIDGPFENPPPTFTRAQEAALDLLIAREGSRGNRTVIVDLPTRPDYDRLISKYMRSHYARYMESLRARTDIDLVRASDLPPLSLGDFNDFTHLSAGGRAKVSARLAEILVGLRR
jgi:hypothetical protein